MSKFPNCSNEEKAKQSSILKENYKKDKKPDKILLLKQKIESKEQKNRKKVPLIPVSLFSKKLFCALLKMYLLIFSISSNLNQNYDRKLQMAFSEISMEIIGTIGEQNVINNFCPDEIYLNDIKISEGSCSINLSNQGNVTIKLIWFNQLTNCRSMFFGLSNIIKKS